MSDEIRDSIVWALNQAKRSYASLSGYPISQEPAAKQIRMFQEQLQNYDRERAKMGEPVGVTVFEEIRNELREIKTLLKSKGPYR